MKRVAIMQPYFFPYLGYFSLIKHTDRFILFDPVQFIRHGWIERNRVLKQDEGWLYIKVPLKKHERSTLIKDIIIDNDQPWQSKLMAQLAIYKKRSPYYNQVISLVETVISQKHSNIVSLNRAAIEAVCSYLNIVADIVVFSKMNLRIEPARSADEWALNICKALDVKEYWNSPGGESFFDRQKYQTAGINLVFQKLSLKPYDQHRPIFEAGLSIIDAMMFNSPEEINTMLDSYELA